MSNQENALQATWEQRPGADTDTWERKIEARTYCYVTQFPGATACCWQVARGDDRLAGSAVNLEAAMKQADDIMALPVDEFTQMRVAELVDEFRKLERDLMRLAPTAVILPGYHAGYEAGVADIKRKIAAAIDLDHECVEQHA